MKNCRSKPKTQSIAWIDDKNAFSSVPLASILKVLNILKEFLVIITFLKYNMEKWHQNFRLIHKEDMLKTNNQKVSHGIFQGHSLSLLFDRDLIPTTIELNITD